MTTPLPPYGAYPLPPQGAYAGYYGYPQPRPTNALAIVSFVCAFLFAPLGIIFGHLSLSQITKTGEEAATPSPVDNNLPPFDLPRTLGSNCQYPATTEPASKPVKPPQNGRIATDPALVHAGITTSQDPVGLELDNGKTPCTVNNFTSLAKQGFFENTKCHRLSTSTELGVLQCGDPTGTGTGGPGYRFPNEYPTTGPAPTAASSSWFTRILSCRRPTRCSAPSMAPG